MAPAQAGATATAPPGTAESPQVTPLRHPWRWVLAVGIIGAIAMLGIALYDNPNIDHATIAHYQLSSTILIGVGTTVELAVISQTIAIALGVVLAMARLSRNPVLALASRLYVWLLRGVPLLVQILVWGNFGVLFKHLVIGIPYTHVALASFVTSNILTVLVASVIALSTSEGAYMAEIVRAGILSVDEGQKEAALALGMTRTQAMRRIVLPQALKVIVPPTGNDVVTMLKNTSLVSVIAGGDLLTRAQDISAQNLRTLELLFVATVWYLVLTSLTGIIQARIERRMARASSDVAAVTARRARVLSWRRPRLVWTGGRR